MHLKIETTARGAARHRAGALKPDLGALTGPTRFHVVLIFICVSFGSAAREPVHTHAHRHTQTNRTGVEDAWS